MRIISGKFKGRKIVPLKNLPTRPTTDFAKEALFNILENKLELDQCKVLDLFAGTGNISFEFASRGCPKIVAIDQNNLCVKSIRKTIDEFQMLEIETKIADSLSLISKKAVESFDLIFADPPFDFTPEKYNQIIHSVFNNGWLAENGILIIEHASSVKTNSIDFQNILTRKYGNVSFSFFQKS